MKEVCGLEEGGDQFACSSIKSDRVLDMYTN